jgi:ubiquinone/menaquinone biosynthesis C-methylase UbiE
MKKQIATRWFKGWSNEYDNTLGRISFHKDLVNMAVRYSGVKDNHKVLDIGCGTGLLSLKFLKAADCSITGIDNSKDMLAIFKDKVKRLNLNKKVALKSMDANSLKFNNDSFDIIASVVTLHHLKNKHRPLKKIYGILKPGGLFIIGDIDMDTTGCHTDINRLKRILRILEDEWICALKEAGVDAFRRMFDNGKKHILNEGEYCISFKEWTELCKTIGFRVISVKSIPGHKEFKVLVAQKPGKY